MTKVRRLRPPPDLQALVLRHGGWQSIPPEAWAKWDRDYEEYRILMRAGQLEIRDDEPAN